MNTPNYDEPDRQIDEFCSSYYEDTPMTNTTLPNADTSLLDEGALESNEAYQFFMRPDPNQRQFLGDIQEEEDPVTGRIAKFRMAKIGMTRNAQEDKMVETKVFLGFDGNLVHPHMRTEKAKPLQGWYQPKHNESAQSRPRPCFSEAMLTQPYGGYCPVGCKFSLPGGELVQTPDGWKAIQDFSVGDPVYGRTLEGVVTTTVEGITRHEQPLGYVQVTLSSGAVLRMTADHPVVYRGTDGKPSWKAAGELTTEDCMEKYDDRKYLPGLRGIHSEITETVRQLLEGALTSAGESPEKGIASLLDVRKPYALPYPEGLRQLPSGGKVSGQGFESRLKGQELGTNPGNEAEDEHHRSGQPGFDVSAGFWLKIPGIPGSPCDGREEWGEWLQAIQALRMGGWTGQNVQDAESVGTLDSSVVGQEGLPVGVRTAGVPASFWAELLARLSAWGREVFGGEGVCSAEGHLTDSRNESAGLPVEWEGVAKVESIPGTVTVYDIQTGTRNFYQRGYLVHNCYINAGFRGYRGSGLITVPTNFGDQVGKMLDKSFTASAGYFSSFTDPFNGLEQYYHNSQSGAEAFVARGLPVFFLSRLSYPGWAFDLLKQSPFSYAQKSLNTGNAADFHKLSPGAISLGEHLEEIRALRKAGIYTSIQVNPVVPGITPHEDIYSLFEQLAAVGNNHVIVKFVEAGYSWAPAMVERLTKAFGTERAGKFAALFTENQPGSQKTIAESYRMEAHHLYRDWATKFGMTYATCYEYVKDPETRRAVSVGKKFATSDQCHGQRVPVFNRNRLAEPFAEEKACPPSGCLYCADDNEGKARCGNELLGQATALTSSDFRESKSLSGIAVKVVPA